MQVRFRQRLVSSLVIGGALIASLGDGAFAQLVPDITLGSENSRVTPMTPTIDQINGGATRGANLFHSFQEFNVGEGRSAYFTNPAGIENILTRVTGTNPSNILGTLGVSGGNANLFLINPNGIIFGANASLDVGGSFVASTASSIKFADGTEFSAVNPSAPPLLTISVPIGLQFNGTEGDIVVQDSNQTPAPDNPFTEVGDAGQLPSTAQPVNSPTDGTTVNAISGNLDNDNDVDLYQLFLTEGQPFTANTVDGTEVDTQLFLFDGSGLGLSSNDDTASTLLQSTVPLNEPFTPAASGTYYLGISSYDNDPLSSQGYIFGASGEPTGPGAGLPLSDWDANYGLDSGAYTIMLNLQPDTSIPIPPREGLQVQPGRTLALVGGNVTIQGGNLQALGGRVEIGGVAGSGTLGLNVDGNNLGLSFPDDVTRADVSVTNGAGIDVRAEDGGSIAINARNLNISGGSVLAAGIGENLGSIDSQAEDITLNATGTITIANSLAFNDVEAGGVGNGGNININAGSLSITDGAQVSASIFGRGNAGNVYINVRDTATIVGGVVVRQPDGSYFIPSTIFNDVGAGGVGNSGNININAGSLSITDGAQVSASIFGRGNSGSIFLQVDDSVSLARNSAVFNDVEAGGVGNGGNININARSLSITDGAFLSASTSGQGNSGSIFLQTDESVSLARSSAIFSQVQAGGVGNGGDINITAGSLSLTDGAELQAFVGYDSTRRLPSGRGDAGDVNINVRDTVTLVGRGRDSGTPITAIWNGVGFRGAEGNGGDININARSLSLTNAHIAADTNGNGDAGDITIRVVESIYLTNSDSVLEGSRRSRIGSAVTHEAVGNGGDIDIQARSLFLDNGAVLDASTKGNGDGGNIRVSVNTLAATNGGQIFTTSGSTGHAGTISLNATDSVTLSGSDPNFAQRRSPNAVINPDAASGVFARTEGVGDAGNLRIETDKLTVRDGAAITVSSMGAGLAGLLIVEANSIRLDNKATISADTRGGGGNINLYTGDLILRRGSSISTDARGRYIPGGNITIDTDNLVAVPKEDSDITAKAQESFGGRVIVNATGIFGTQFRPQDTLLSDITASSALGPQFNGIVQLNTPDIDPSRGLANLPTEVVDASNQIAQTCGAGGREARKNEFIITGRRGLPSNPYEMLSDDEALPDVHPPSGFSSSRNSKPVAAKTVTSQSATSNPKPPIVEAQGWVINDKGQVVLTATASTATPHNSGLGSATCPSS
jgi:filamentous hemagglutinin family protein